MKRHSQAWSAAAVAIVLLGVATPGSMGASQAPVALSGTMPGSGYVAVKLDFAGGAPVELRITAEGCRAGCAFGGTMIHPSGATFSAVLTLPGTLGNGDCLVVRSPDVGQDLHDCHESIGYGPYYDVLRQVGGSSRVSFWNRIDAGDTPGVWTLLVWMAFKADQQSPTSWQLAMAPQAATILGVTSGDRAWYAAASDFQEGTALLVSQGGAFASANVGSRLPLKVENTLIGIMKTDSWTPPSPAGGLTFRGPDFTQTCSCWLWNFTGPNAVGPGVYDLSLDRVAGGHQGYTDVRIVLIDPRLPG